MRVAGREMMETVLAAAGVGVLIWLGLVVFALASGG